MGLTACFHVSPTRHLDDGFTIEMWVCTIVAPIIHKRLFKKKRKRIVEKGGFIVAISIDIDFANSECDLGVRT